MGLGSCCRRATPVLQWLEESQGMEVGGSRSRNSSSACLRQVHCFWRASGPAAGGVGVSDPFSSDLMCAYRSRGAPAFQLPLPGWSWVVEAVGECQGAGQVAASETVGPASTAMSAAGGWMGGCMCMWRAELKHAQLGCRGGTQGMSPSREGRGFGREYLQFSAQTGAAQLVQRMLLAQQQVLVKAGGAGRGQKGGGVQ
jgi:hypothetical protein